MSKGYVYILSNASMPGLLKIGKTTRSVKQRCSELWQTGVPTPFKVEHEVLSPDCSDLERVVHDSLGELRLSKSREFFEVSISSAVKALNAAHIEQVDLLREEFAPDHMLVPECCFVDPGDLSLTAHRAGVQAKELADAISFLEADEVMSAVTRWREFCVRRGIRMDYHSVGRGNEH